jgi:hypothetical protein
MFPSLFFLYLQLLFFLPYSFPKHFASTFLPFCPVY